MNNELVRLAAAVRKMRDAQRAYFADRSQANLRCARAHEEHVDDCVRWVRAASDALAASHLPAVRPTPAQQQQLEEA